MAGIKPEAVAMPRAGWKLPSNVGARLAWEGRRVWRRLGWCAGIGVFCSVLAVLALWQTQQSAQRQQSFVKKLQAVSSISAEKPVSEVTQGDIARQVAVFYAYLPQHDAIPDRLKRLINLAEKNGMTLAQAEYKPQPEVNADFLRYQIVLPVKAAYPNIQSFILDALQELPTLTLESIAFKRDRIESPEVEARIHYILLVKKSGAKGAGQ